MKTINYSDIDLSKLDKLDISSSESDVYVGIDEDKKIKIYKMFKSDLGIYELTLKNEKLKLLEQKNLINSIIVPDAKIVNPNLLGTREEYVDGIDLCYANLKYQNEEIMNILLNVSKDLKQMHDDEIIMSDLNFGNIRIDRNKGHHFLDVLSYSIDRIPANTISRISLDYLKKNKKKIKASKNNDKIAFLLLTIQFFINKYFYDITDYDFYETKEKIKQLKDLEEIYYDLKDGYVKDVPYLHELVR